MYPITITPSNETLKVLKVSYTLSVIDGSVRPTVHSPMHITKEKLLEMWFSTELNLKIITNDVECYLVENYT